MSKKSHVLELYVEFQTPRRKENHQNNLELRPTQEQSRCRCGEDMRKKSCVCSRESRNSSVSLKQTTRTMNLKLWEHTYASVNTSTTLVASRMAQSFNNDTSGSAPFSRESYVLPVPISIRNRLREGDYRAGPLAQVTRCHSCVAVGSVCSDFFSFFVCFFFVLSPVFFFPLLYTMFFHWFSLVFLSFLVILWFSLVYFFVLFGFLCFFFFVEFYGFIF